MKRNTNQSHLLSFVMRLFTILLCFAAGGFCLFKSGIGQSVEQPAVAASAPVKTAQAPSSSSEYKLKSVADFKVGDTIMALNHETGQREQKRVKQTFQRQVDHLRILEVQGEDGSTQTIQTTDEHPFWVPAADEYVAAKHLTPGTRLTGANGHFITVTSPRHEPHPEGVTVYNVEVEGFHNYFVAANGYRGPPVLAHNACDLTVTHFTDKKGYDAINSQNEKLFRASSPKGKTGNPKGVYLTDKTIDEIKLKTNGFKKLGLTRAKSEYFFTFKVDKSQLKELRGNRGIFYSSSDLIIKDILASGLTPR